MKTTASAIKLPFTQAVDYFRQKVDVPSAHWTAVMDEAHARSFAVAGATNQALIKDFRSAIDTSISEGTGYQKFRETFDDLVKKYGWSHTGTADWRARVIYQTNMANAFSAGRYAQQTDPDVLRAFPYWQYQHVNCPYPRLMHLAWSGMVLRADDPWWDAHYPPNGWGCHCIVLSVGERGLAKLGKTRPDKAPPANWATYVDRTTGVVTRYPFGVDPGFAFNPGKAWKDGLKQPVKSPNVRLVGPSPPVLARPGEAAVPPPVLRKFLDDPGGQAVQVAELAADAAPADKRAVVLDAEGVKASPAIDQAAIGVVAELLAAHRERLSLTQPVTLRGHGLLVTMRWNAAQGVWVINSIETP
jgi:hypothetical protein